VSAPAAALARRICPGCQSAMQAFFAGTVELDRCALTVQSSTRSWQ
jgi:hypothetical protein